MKLNEFCSDTYKSWNLEATYRAYAITVPVVMIMLNLFGGMSISWLVVTCPLWLPIAGVAVFGPCALLWETMRKNAEVTLLVASITCFGMVIAKQSGYLSLSWLAVTFPLWAVPATFASAFVSIVLIMAMVQIHAVSPTGERRLLRLL